MPTDGADFARRRAAYGQVFIKIKKGASEQEVAESVVGGLRREIRTDGEARIFKPLALLLAEVTRPQQLFSDADKRTQLAQQICHLENQFADASLSRHFAEAARRVALAAIDSGRALSSEEAGAEVLWGVAQSTCLDPADAYALRHRCGSVSRTTRFFESVGMAAAEGGELSKLVSEMLASPTGTPNRPKRPRVTVEHTAEGLSNHIISAI